MEILEGIGLNQTTLYGSFLPLLAVLTGWYIRRLQIRLRAEASKRAELEQEIIRSSKLAALGTLSAGMAHELNNPLAIIMGILEEVEDNPSQARKFEIIRKAVDRMHRIILHLRLYAGQKDPSNPELVSINQVIRDSAILFESQLVERGIKLTLRLDPSIPQVEGYKTLLESVFCNLISNSRDAFSSQPKNHNPEIHPIIHHEIHIDTSFSSGEVQVLFEDNAGGMNPTVLGKIFDPFFSTKQREAGIGLGMSIVNTVMKHHHGKIEPRSTEGKGTTFLLKFPVRFPAKSHSAQPHADLPEHSTSMPHPPERPKYRILIVDDQEQLCAMLARKLKNHFTIEYTTDPAEAVAWVGSRSYDLILTDLVMPRVSGAKILEAAKRSHNKLPVIVMSGYAPNEDTVREILDGGAKGFISKPFSDIKNLSTKLLSAITH